MHIELHCQDLTNLNALICPVALWPSGVALKDTVPSDVAVYIHTSSACTKNDNAYKY